MAPPRSSLAAKIIVYFRIPVTPGAKSNVVHLAERIGQNCRTKRV